MKDTVDVEGIRLLGETHTVVSDAEAKLCAASLQPLHISHTTFGETLQAREDAHGRFTIQAADLGASQLGEDNSFHLDSGWAFRLSTVRPKSDRTSSNGIPGWC